MWQHLAGVVNATWLDGCLSSNTQSGEGIVHRIRDEQYGIPPGRRKKGEPAEEQLLDPGVSDKRLLIAEEEFSHSLKMEKRSGNTLTELLRVAWDSPRLLKTSNKNSPLKATDPHVSLIGHTTRDELLATLNMVDLNNGMANRVLWCAAKRTGDMPDAEPIFWREQTEILDRLKGVLQQRFANTDDPAFIARSQDAKNYWDTLYCKLNAEKQNGTLDAVLARDTSHILKLSLILAITDQAMKIERRHIEAALAIVDFCQASARWIFGKATNNKLANTILWELRRHAPAGLSREKINTDVCYSNTPKSQLDRAFSALVQNNLAKMIVKEGEKGRRVEMWFSKA